MLRFNVSDNIISTSSSTIFLNPINDPFHVLAAFLAEEAENGVPGDLYEASRRAESFKVFLFPSRAFQESQVALTFAILTNNVNNPTLLTSYSIGNHIRSSVDKLDYLYAPKMYREMMNFAENFMMETINQAVNPDPEFSSKYLSLAKKLLIHLEYIILLACRSRRGGNDVASTKLLMAELKSKKLIKIPYARKDFKL